MFQKKLFWGELNRNLSSRWLPSEVPSRVRGIKISSKSSVRSLIGHRLWPHYSIPKTMKSRPSNKTKARCKSIPTCNNSKPIPTKSTVRFQISPMSSMSWRRRTRSFSRGRVKDSLLTKTQWIPIYLSREAWPEGCRKPPKKLPVTLRSFTTKFKNPPWCDNLWMNLRMRTKMHHKSGRGRRHLQLWRRSWASSPVWIRLIGSLNKWKPYPSISAQEI